MSHDDASTAMTIKQNEWDLKPKDQFDGEALDPDSALLIEQTRNEFLEDEMRRMTDELASKTYALQILRNAGSTGYTMKEALTESYLDYAQLKHESKQREDALLLQIEQLHIDNRIATNLNRRLKDHADIFYKRWQALMADVTILLENRRADRTPEDKADVKTFITSYDKDKTNAARVVCQAWLRGECDGRCPGLKHPANVR